MTAADRVAGGLVHSAQRLLPLDAGEPCGDGALHLARARKDGGCTHLLAIVDGLGHGVHAATATQAALQQLRAQPDADLPALMQSLDGALRHTRGAALGLARLAGRELRYLGVGNTRAVLWHGDRLTRLPSHGGIVGAGIPSTAQAVRCELAPGDWLLLFTDGIDERVALPVRLPEWERDPGLLCEHLLSRHRNVRDDAGVLVLQAKA